MPNLLTPLQIKQMKLKNRIVLPPLATEKCKPDGLVKDDLIEHYVHYAQAGVGLIITEHAYIAPKGQASPGQMSVADDGVLPGLTKLATAIHAAGGVAGVQINHCGMAGKSEIVGEPVGPSALPHPRRDDGPVARELSREEIKSLVRFFAQAAGRVKRAGFDMVEIHSAHGYLISQFNSPLTNHRQDEYGGSLEKRALFGREVIEAVRREVGPDFPVLFRLGADDLMEGGLTLEDSKKLAPLFVEAGVDLLDLSGGLGGYRADAEQGFFVYLSEGLKEVVDVPLITTGGVIEPAFANQVVERNQADLVGVGRAMLKDPDWATKAIKELA